MSGLTVLRDAVQEAYGLPCDDFDPECAGCRSWKALFVTQEQFDRLRAENARLREALIDAADMLSGATFEVMRVRGQYIDRKDVVCRARAALQTEGGE